MKSLLFVICLILFSQFVFASSLSMSPPQIDFEGQTGETICSEVELVSIEPTIVVGKTLWAEEGFFERNLLEHKLSPEELKLEVDIEEEIFLENYTKVDICVEGSRKGHYHGLLLYKIDNKPVQVGIWLNVSLGGSNKMSISGKSISEEGLDKNKFLGISFILVIILVGLIFVGKRKD